MSELRISRCVRAACIGVVAALQVACVALMPAPTPLHTLEYASAVQPAKCLFVLLPGAGDPAERFRDRSGGLKQWQAPPRVDAMSRDNYQRELWRWLQAATQGRETAPAIFLGYGTSDRLRRADSLLAGALPSARVFLTTGGHEWPTWRRVLASFLQSPEFARHCR